MWQCISVYLLGIRVPYCPIVWGVLVRTSCSHLAFRPRVRGIVACGNCEARWLLQCRHLPASVVRGVWLGTSGSSLPLMFPPPSLGSELQGKSSSQLLLWERPSVRPEMKEEPRTGLDLFKFFCVGFGKGGHVNFIGVGQDLGLKMPVCLVLAVPLVRRSALAQGMRGSRRMGGGGSSLSGCHRTRGQCFCSLSHLGHSERLSA